MAIYAIVNLTILGSIPVDGRRKMISVAVGLITLVCALVVIAFFTLAERKVIASVQRRRGPNVVGVFGMLQAIADGLKLVGKEIIIPSKANTDLFILAPIITFATSLIN